jgi:hypothetical protein
VEGGIGRQRAFPTISVSLEESAHIKHQSQRQTLPAVNKACEGGRMKLFRPYAVERKEFFRNQTKLLYIPRDDKIGRVVLYLTVCCCPPQRTCLTGKSSSSLS